MTGIAVPKYYNPAAVNPLKYAEQVQKRKLLWSKSKDKKEVRDSPMSRTMDYLRSIYHSMLTLCKLVM